MNASNSACASWKAEQLKLIKLFFFFWWFFKAVSTLRMPSLSPHRQLGNPHEKEFVTDVTGAPKPGSHFCSRSLFIVLAYVEHLQTTGHLRALNSALGQLLVLIAVADLLCDLKTVTY